MDNYIPIDASRARSNFFDILKRVFLEDEIFLIKKAGIPVAKIMKPSVAEGKDIMSFAGLWKDAKAGEIIAFINEGRRDKASLKRKIPKIN